MSGMHITWCYICEMMIQTEKAQSLSRNFSRPTPQDEDDVLFIDFCSFSIVFLRHCLDVQLATYTLPKIGDEKICNEVKREPISPCFSRAPSKTHNFRLTHSRFPSSLLGWTFLSSPPWIFICEHGVAVEKTFHLRPVVLPFPTTWHKQKDFQDLISNEGRLENSSATWIVHSRGFSADEKKWRKINREKMFQWQAVA